jgi:signal transduction histidine kinase/CheY-like chemotaxis protein
VNLWGAQLPGIRANYVDGRLVMHIAVLGDARRLSYRLLGLDDRWREMPADLGIAYHWLPPGAYRLQVRQLQRDGTWGANAELSLPIDIAPPWWRTAWAYALYALASAALSVAAGRAFMAWRHRELRSQLKQGNVRLSIALQAAEHATEAKARFLAMMSHEIRTPINGVIGMVELLSDSPMDDEQRAQLSVCKDSAHLLLAIVNDILDFSKIEAGKLALENAPLSLRRLVVSVVQSLRLEAAGKGIGIEMHVARAVPRRLLGDAVRLRQVLTNLVANAVKFTQAGGVQVFVRVVDSPGTHLHRIRFEVVDTGIGMAPETLSQLFQPFHQADSGTARRFGGTGLGLTIVRHLVTLMGGDIQMQSEVGKGSRFYVDLPMESIDVGRRDASIAQVRAIGADVARRTAPPSGATILIVDDNAMNREVLTRQLRRLGYRFDVAADGEQAWEMLQSGRAYGLLLTDCQMPRLDGFALAGRIRAEEAATGQARLPIVAFTANALEDERERCLRAGMDAFLIKPVQMAALRRVLSRMFPDAPTPTPTPASAEDDAKLRQRLLEIFETVTRAEMQGWREARRSGDRARLQQLAHKLKTGSMVIGENALTDCLERVETHGGPDIELEALAAQAQRELEAAVARAAERRTPRLA